ncbi:MAG: hypothetical protein ACI9YM_001120 [Brevundimonas sp.]|jgi:hypothetical protein|uniref:hypothetical protein n=1 Tax=Brevundimonas sp. TaxID=1871086 RepID=UPI0039E30F51
MRGLAVAAALGLAGCASVAPGRPAGPGAADLARLLAVDRAEAPPLRAVRCDLIAEEGSEWVCRYEERSREGLWVGLSTMVARAGAGWELIDRPCSADEALADRGRCPR